MNKLLIVMLSLVLSVNAFAGDGFNKLYSKYAGTDNITSINLTETMIVMLSKFIDGDDEEAKELLESVKAVKLLVAENGNDGLVSETKALMKTGNYEALIKIKDGDNHVSIVVEEHGDIIKEVVVFVESDEELVVINITGDIDPNKVGKVLNTLDIEVEGLDIH